MKTENEYSDILSMVTHDLKSPLCAAMGALELLSEDDLSKSDKKECIKIARVATNSIYKLVEDILVMAKHEAGKEHIEPAEVKNLGEYFDEIVKTFKYQMKVKNINFDVKVPSELPNVYWDIDKIKYHVINNIISNAIKFTRDDGRISMSVESMKNSQIVIKVKDDGIGILNEKRKSVFQKFDTHNNKKVYKGTGLGLYNAYCFVQKHGGEIKVINGIGDKGIGFKITLPIKGY